jgi:hypothetical protein
VFTKTEYWDQLPSLSSESKREDGHGALFAPGLSKWIFSRDTHICLYNAVSYPPSPTSSESNMRNALENIVRMEQGKIVTRYSLSAASSLSALFLAASFFAFSRSSEA